MLKTCLKFQLGKLAIAIANVNMGSLPFRLTIRPACSYINTQPCTRFHSTNNNTMRTHLEKCLGKMASIKTAQ